jgi:hypothetical protein
MLLYLCALGHEVIDVGTCSNDPVDYPDYAEAMSVVVREGRADRGIIICGSGGARFLGEERHRRRLEKVRVLELRYSGSGGGKAAAPMKESEP